MKLTIGLATRNRPSMLMETLKETLQHVRNDSTRVVVLADTDDLPTVESMESWMFDDPRVILDIRERPDSVAEKWNRMVEIAPADVYLPAADDAPHQTPGFDQKILDASRLLPDGIGMIYNHMHNLSFPTIQAFPARMVELLGCIYVTHFPYWFVDHWVDDVARMIGRIACADVTVHDKRPGTMDKRDPALWATLYDALYKSREEDAERIFAAPDFQCEEWRKDMLRSSWCLIHERGRMLNNIVRGMADIDITTDERYQRIKKKGEEMLKAAYWELEAAERKRRFSLEREAA